MRTASSESSNGLRHSAVAVSRDASPPPGYHFPLQSAASIPPCISDARDNSTPSPWRGRGVIDTTSLCDETRSLSNSVRSTRRRRGGDVSGFAGGEGKDWTQAFMDLERMRRENQGFLHGPLRGDRSEIGSLLDDTLARSRSGSSVMSSVRRRRRGVAAGASNSEVRVASYAPFEHSLSGTPLVGDSVADTPKAETPTAAPVSRGIMNDRRYGSTSGVAEARLTFSPPHAAYSPDSAEKQSRYAVPMSGRTSGLPNWLKRPTAEPSRGSIMKALANTCEAAAVVAAEVTEREEASLCVQATPSAHSPAVNTSVEKLSEAARLSSLTTPPAHASLPSSPALLVQRTHTDPVAARTLSSLHSSRSRTDAANPRRATPTVYPSSSSSATAATTLVEGAKPAYRPTRASQSLAQRSSERHAKAAAVVTVSVTPSWSPRGNARFPPTSGKLALSTVPSTSSTLAAALTAAGVVDTSPKPSAEAPVAAACAAELAEEKVRSSVRCVSASVVLESKSKSPDPQPRLQSAAVEDGRASTVGSCKARAQSKTGAVAEPESPCGIPRAPNVSASGTRALPHDRAASAMRPGCGVRHSGTLLRLPSGGTAEDDAESRFVPRAAASVPRERKHTPVVRLLRGGTLSGTSQPKGCDATQPSGGGQLHRSTTLTELRRQEVLRDRLARERKAAEEARARLVVPKQRVASSFITSNARAVEVTSLARVVVGSVETLSLSSRQVSRSRRRTSAVTRLRVSPTLMTVASPSLTAPATPASHLHLSTQSSSHLGAQQSGEGIGVTVSNAQKASAAPRPSDGTPAAGSGHCSRGEVKQSRSLPTDAKRFAHLPKPLKKHLLSRARPHLPSAAAANTNSSSASTNASVWRVEQWVSTMASHPRPLSAETEAFSPPMDVRGSPPRKATAHAESAASTMLSSPPSVLSEMARISVTDTRKQRPLPFCVECGHRHMNDSAKFCALCGHQRAYLCC